MTTKIWHVQFGANGSNYDSTEVVARTAIEAIKRATTLCNPPKSHPVCEVRLVAEGK